MAAPAKLGNNFTQDIQQSGPILIVVKDRFLTIASGGHISAPGYSMRNGRAMTLR
jgi:hypothetical protein